MIRVHRAHRSLAAALRPFSPVITLSPPSSSPDERTNDGTLGAIARIPCPHARMTTTVVTPTLEQIRHNVMEEAREYQDERIEMLTDQNSATYSRTFIHAAIIAHWATLFHKPVSTMLVNFSATPSIAIPTIRNLDPPPIFPTTSGSGLAAQEPELEYPAEDDDWEVQSVESGPALPIPPPEHIHPEVLAHLHTLHVDNPAPPLHDLGPNRKPITPTDPVPAMPSSPPQFLQVDPLDAAPSFTDVVDALVQCDVDAQVARIAREEEDKARTPSLTGPQPGVHPGPGWRVNFKDTGVHYMFYIPTDDAQRAEIAPFVMIDWNTTSPELLGMRGRGCPVHAKHLHACADEFPRPAFDRRQEFFFEERQTHSEGVDWAMQQEGDDTLRAEVVRNRAAHAASRMPRSNWPTSVLRSSSQHAALPGPMPIAASIATSHLPSPPPCLPSRHDTFTVSRKWSTARGIGPRISSAISVFGANRRATQWQTAPSSVSVTCVAHVATSRRTATSLTHAASASRSVASPSTTSIVAAMPAPLP